MSNFFQIRLNRQFSGAILYRYTYLVFMLASWLLSNMSYCEENAAADPAAEPASADQPVAGAFVLLGDESPEGEVKVILIGDQEYKNLKKEVELGNKAAQQAYQKLKNAHREKYLKEYKAELEKVRQQNNNNQGRQQNQQGFVKRNNPPFLLSKPEPRVLHYYGSFPTEADAETKKKVFEDRETARQAKIQEQEIKEITSNSAGTSGQSNKRERSKLGSMTMTLQKPDIYGKSQKKAECPKELREQFDQEVEKIKQELTSPEEESGSGMSSGLKGSPDAKGLLLNSKSTGNSSQKGTSRKIIRLGEK